MIKEIEESQCDECGQWTDIEDLEEIGDDVELHYLCPHCSFIFYQNESQSDWIEM